MCNHGNDVWWYRFRGARAAASYMVLKTESEKARKEGSSAWYEIKKLAKRYLEDTLSLFNTRDIKTSLMAIMLYALIEEMSEHAVKLGYYSNTLEAKYSLTVFYKYIIEGIIDAIGNIISRLEDKYESMQTGLEDKSKSVSQYYR